MRKLLAFVSAVLLVYSFSARADAAFHLMRISEVLVGIGGDATIQFVELQMTSGGQTDVSGHELFFFDAADNPVGTFALGGDVARGTPFGDVLPFILIATADFECAFDLRPDFVMPEGLLRPEGGRVSWEGPALGSAIDSVAYGSFTAANTGYGTPAPAPNIFDRESLMRTRTASPRDNSTDYTLQGPSPTNNAFARHTREPPACFLADNFTDLSNWDKPADNAGLDFNLCGFDAALDIGTVTATGNKLVLTTGMNDLPMQTFALSFTGMKNSVVTDPDSGFADESYRAKFNLVTHAGIETVILLTRGHYLFDDGTSTIDTSQASAYGIDFEVDEPGETHIHNFISQPCLQYSEQEQIQLPGFFIQSEMEYTFILDIDGDDINGPLTLQMKIFRAGEPEPSGYLGAFKLATGIPGSSGDEELDHGVIFAAVGDPNASMDISSFSICPIPTRDQHVRCLTCLRREDGSIELAWENPFEPENQPIRVLINGQEVASLADDATSTVIQSPPAGDLTIAVVNYSCTPATCTLCDNDPPDVVIDGPASAPFDNGTGMALLDSVNSSDPEMGALTRFWEVVSRPQGASAMIDDAGAVAIHLTVNMAGTYTVRLTINDDGCTGDQPAFASAEHTVTFSTAPAGVGPFIRGDCNGDGQVSGTVTDAVFSLNFKFLGGNPPPCIAACDASGDGQYSGTVTDDVYLLNFNFLGGPRPPAPYPTCALSSDPEDATLGCANTRGCSG